MAAARTTDAYHKAYTGLNAAQRLAVDTLEGPVLVLAGPGTGKTQLLATRIAHLLAQTDTEARNVLCLTYTDAAASNMRRRLAQMIGPAASQVTITTFHGFCNQVILDRPERFAFRDQAQPISDVEHFQLLQQLIDRLPISNPLRRTSGDIHYEVKRLQNFYATIRREGWDSERFRRGILEYIAMLPQWPDFYYKKKYGDNKAGDPKVKKIQEETEAMELLMAALELYPAYQAAMHEALRYTFDDMIRWVVDAMTKDDELASELQELFHYVLVDEYQDTSGSQNQLVFNLMKHWGQDANLLVVGDDDQTIYRFQGASLDNLKQFLKLYPNATVCCLTENYRSTQVILDHAQALIQHNGEHRLVQDEALQRRIPGLSKNLVARGAVTKLPQRAPQYLSFPDPSSEAIWIAEQVERLIASGVAPGQIAVLYLKRRLAQDVLKTLMQRRVPIYNQSSENLLKEVAVRHLINLLRLLPQLRAPFRPGDRDPSPDNEYELLYEVFVFPYWEISPVALHALFEGYRQANRQSEGPRRSLLEYILRAFPGEVKPGEVRSPDPLIDAQDAYRIRALAADLIEWSQSLSNETPTRLLEKILTRGGWLDFALRTDASTHLLQVLKGFYDWVEGRLATAPELGLAGLLDELDLMQRAELPLEVRIEIGTPEGVHCGTLHSSKGLEFGHVFMIQSAQQPWRSKGGQQKEFKIPKLPGYTVPDMSLEELKIKIEADKDHEKTARLTEQRRLFFVGMTRAEQTLHITWSDRDKAGKAQDPVQFVTEIQSYFRPIDQPEPKDNNPDDSAREAFLLHSLRPLPNEPLPLLPPERIAAALENFVLSATSLKAFLEDPRGFYYQYIVKVPVAPNAAMGFGNVIHSTLEHAFVQRKATGHLPATADLIDHALEQLRRHRDHFTTAEYAARQAQIREELPLYIAAREAEWATLGDSLVERSLSGTIDGVAFRGVVDRADRLPGGWRIIDYKTGKLDAGSDNFKRPFALDPDAYGKMKNAPLDTFHGKYGGDYWRQAVLYDLLAAADPKLEGMPLTEVLFDPVQLQRGKVAAPVPVLVTPEDRAFVRDLIQQAWAGIQQHAFAPAEPTPAQAAERDFEDRGWRWLERNPYRRVD